MQIRRYGGSDAHAARNERLDLFLAFGLLGEFVCEDFCEPTGENARMGQMDETYGVGHDDNLHIGACRVFLEGLPALVSLHY